MTVLITLTIAGADSGPFDLYSDLDGYVSAFETGVLKSALLSGYSSALVPDYTNIIRVKSVGVCNNYIDISLISTTTTTTTIIPVIGTIDISNFSLDVSINVDSITVNGITVTQTGGPTPLLPGNSANAETTQLGTYDIYITGASTTLGQNIVVTDSNGTTQCLSAGGGTGSWTFTGVVIDGITNIMIDANDGTCI